MKKDQVEACGWERLSEVPPARREMSATSRNQVKAALSARRLTLQKLLAMQVNPTRAEESTWSHVDSR